MSTVFIGNLPAGVSEEEIFDVMGSVGHVVELRWPVDKATGRRGDKYCFCDYVDTASAAIALAALDGVTLRDRQLRIRPPSREEQPPSPPSPRGEWRQTPAPPRLRLTDFMPPLTWPAERV